MYFSSTVEQKRGFLAPIDDLKQPPNALILALAWGIILLALGFGLLSSRDQVSKILGLLLVVLGVFAFLVFGYLFKRRHTRRGNN